MELEFFEKLFKSLDVGTHGVISVYRSDKFTPVVRWPSIKGGYNKALPPGTPTREAVASGQKSGTFEYVAAVDGIRRVYSFKTLDRFPFYVGVGIARDDALAGWRVRLLMVGLSCVCLLILLGSLIYHLWRTDEQLVELNRELEGRVLARTEALRASEQLFHTAFDFSPVGIALVDINGKKIQANKAYCDMIGYSEQEWKALEFMALNHPDDSPRHRKNRDLLLAGSIPEYQDTLRIRRKSGDYIFVVVNAALRLDAVGNASGLILQYRDITEQKRAELQTQQALREKEVLLKEIYHRVKNNLQVVSSLLSMQGKNAGTESRGLLEESANRVKSMALVHEQLYRSQNLSSIGWKDYAEQLAQHLKQANGEMARRVATRLEVEDIKLGIETAIPLGLIVNELISNAYKHAYPGDRGGEIVLRLRALEGGVLELEVKDDGVGLPQGFEPRKVTSLGMQLVISLSQQLDGKLDIGSEHGARFTLRFVPDEYEMRRLAAVS